jgi:hypothetical protein
MNEPRRDQQGKYRAPDAHEQFAAGIGAALAAKQERNAARIRRLHPSPSTPDTPEARDIAQSLRKAGLGYH